MWRERGTLGSAGWLKTVSNLGPDERDCLLLLVVSAGWTWKFCGSKDRMCFLFLKGVYVYLHNWAAWVNRVGWGLCSGRGGAVCAGPLAMGMSGVFGCLR
jgi:hypothetical protein